MQVIQIVSVDSGKKMEEAKDRKMSFYVITVDGETAKAFREDF